MRLTDEQIRGAVAAMKISEADKAIITKRALNGEQGARFVVFHALASAKRREG